MPLNDLPPELCEQILTELPVQSLLSFGLVSHAAYALANASLHTLSLGIFHSRMSGLISSLESSTNEGMPVHSVNVLLPKSGTRYRGQVISGQNRTAADILGKRAASLRDLELVLWELKEPVCEALRAMPNLRRLSLCFDHPHIRHGKVDRTYWDLSQPGTIWNRLATTDGGFLDPVSPAMFGRLESINLERAGITDFQLQQILIRNPSIRDLRLQKCLTLTEETFEFLARGNDRDRQRNGTGAVITSRLETFHFTKNNKVQIDERIFKYIPKLVALQSLSFRGCKHLDPEQVQRLNKEQWHIPHLTLPFTPDSPLSQPSGPDHGIPDVLEVDPAYK